MIINIPVIDIETVGDELPTEVIQLREKSIRAPDNYKDPDKIIKYIEEKRESLYRNDALDYDYSKIIAVGYTIDNVLLCDTTCKNSEEMLLKLIRSLIKESGGLCITFNGTSFDIPVIQNRCLKLGVPLVPFSKECLYYDVIRMLQSTEYGVWFDRHKVKSLHEYAYLHGIPVNSDYRGKDISELYKSKNWTEIEKHCLDDAKITKKLYDRILKLKYSSEE